MAPIPEPMSYLGRLMAIESHVNWHHGAWEMLYSRLRESVEASRDQLAFHELHLL